MGIELFFRMIKNVLEIDNGDGCTTYLYIPHPWIQPSVNQKYSKNKNNTIIKIQFFKIQ